MFTFVTLIVPSVQAKTFTSKDKALELDNEFVESLTPEQKDHLLSSLMEAGFKEVNGSDKSGLNSHRFYDVDRIEKMACTGANSGNHTDPDKF